MAVRAWRVNSFTSQPFTGNPAGVVPDATGLSDEQMQAIAAELNDISETVFILPPEDRAHDFRLRYFTARTEVDLCGHATIAALFTLSWLKRLTGGDGDTTVIAETPVGPLRLGLTFDQGELRWARMEQLAPKLAAPTNPHHAADILGVERSSLVEAPEIGCCSTGIWACFVRLADPDALSEIQIDSPSIERLWPENPDLTGIYAFAPTDPDSDLPDGALFTRGRFFSPPKYGIVEDPVTGTASGALYGYLAHHGLIRPGEILYARQGVEMGRPGLVRVGQKQADGPVQISGRAVSVFEAEFQI